MAAHVVPFLLLIRTWCQGPSVSLSLNSHCERLFILQSCMSGERGVAGGRDIVKASTFASCNVHPQAFHRIRKGRIRGSLKARLYGGVNLEMLFGSCSNLLPFCSVSSCIYWHLKETDFLQPRTGDHISSTCHLLGWYLAWSPVKNTDVSSAKMI